jgi:hypothetical protein
MSKTNLYAELLKAQGRRVITVGGTHWYDYKGLMLPACLPHCCFPVDLRTAKQVLRQSGNMLVRWDEGFDCVKESQWWYVIHSEKWDPQKASSNTRSKIRRGKKKLHARLCSYAEILQQGYRICQRATQRYEKKEFLLPESRYLQRIRGGQEVPNVLEFFGVFLGDELVGFSENYIQEGGVFWENIWYVPEFLGDYSSYVLIDAMLDFYLNERGMLFVSDGCRNIYHRTNVHQFLEDVFGFRKAYSLLRVVYSLLLSTAIRVLHPLRSQLSYISSVTHNSLFDKVASLLQQESIRKDCKLIKL